MTSSPQASHTKVSVITVTYNAGPLLSRTLDSVVRQTYAEKELIVVDGQSTDGTLSVIRQYSTHIARWVSEPDGGIYDAMNKGVRMASGEWIIFMNAGDTFASDDVLSRIFSMSDADADIIYGDVVKDGAVKSAPDHYHIYHRMLFCHQSAFAKRQLLLSTPFDTRHRLSADHKFFITQYLQGAHFRHIDLPVSIFDTGGISNSRRSAGLRDNMRVMTETVPFPRCVPHILRLAVPYLLCRLRGK